MVLFKEQKEILFLLEKLIKEKKRLKKEHIKRIHNNKKLKKSKEKKDKCYYCGQYNGAIKGLRKGIFAIIYKYHIKEEDIKGKYPHEKEKELFPVLMGWTWNENINKGECDLWIDTLEKT